MTPDLFAPDTVAPADDAPTGVAQAQVRVVGPEGMRERVDCVVVEEPLEIRARGPGQNPVSVAVTMRTPGNDRELAVGFLYGEGLIGPDVDVIPEREHEREHAPKCRGRACNRVLIELSKPFDGSTLKRNFFATSSCGVCGKATLDQIAVRCPPVAPGPVIARLGPRRLARRSPRRPGRFRSHGRTARRGFVREKWPTAGVARRRRPAQRRR